jgi:CubicO group peptidase (beta-lactamase class C family)
MVVTKGNAMDSKAIATLPAEEMVYLTADDRILRTHVLQPENIIGITSSRGPEEGTVPPSAPRFDARTPYHFDVTSFGNALHAELKDEVVGYAMRLKQHGNTIWTLEWNWAKSPGDGSEGWKPNVRMHVASCSKLITAMAMTRLLNAKKISYDAKIAPHLPAYWAKGPNIDKISFRDLMTHRSGFNTGSDASDYKFMQLNVASGVYDHGAYHYQNMNFGLCRILLATINGDIATNANYGVAFATDTMWDALTISAYANYCRQHVFSTAGVTGARLDHPAQDALAYTFPIFTSGWNSGNLATVSGGAGWHLSVDDLLAVMGAFRREGSIMSNAQAQTMLDDGFGIDVIQGTPIGTLYNKNGLWKDNSGRMEQSLAYFLPQDMEMVVLANSPIGIYPGKFFRDVVSSLYIANIKN